MLTPPYSSFFILHSSFKKATVSAILHSSFFILHSSFFILHYPFYILHLRNPLCQPRYRLIYQVPNCHFIPSTPDKIKNIKTETYDFQSFMTLSQEK